MRERSTLMAQGSMVYAPSGLRRNTLWYRLRRALTTYWQLYLLLAVSLAYLALFAYYPMFGLQIAFKKFSARKGIWGSEWVGMKHFVKFFRSYKCWEIIRNTLTISGYQVLAAMPAPILLALCINTVRSRTFKKSVQLLSYMPHFISTVVMVSILMQIFNPRNGLIASFMGVFGVKISDVFASPSTFPHLFVWSGVWQNAGWSAIIYLAALASVSPELHEAAIVDGASRVQRVRYIDFPTIVPTISILLILNMGRVMNLGFEKIYLMQNDLNISASEVIATYTYKIGLTGNVDYSYSTAISMFNSVINLCLITITNYASRKLSGSGLF